MRLLDFRLTLLCFLLLFFALFPQSTEAHSVTKKRVMYRLSGSVVEQNNEGVSFATIIMLPTGVGVACDVNGRFDLGKLPEGSYTLIAQCVGYAKEEVQISLSGDTTIRLMMKQESIALQQVEVMATFTDKKGGNVKVDKAALEYIQPTSLRDIFLLLPGNVMPDRSMNRFVGLSSRQVGSDDNSSLGMALILDGAAITNDAMRTQMSGITGANRGVWSSGDRAVVNRGSMNSGIDIRTISTDHIGSVEVERGISSASEGNLSSGAIRITSKQGRSPLRIRIKGDPLNKLAYVGKGIRLSDKGGTLYLGNDILHNKSDVREQLESYLRYTMQATYTNQVKWKNGMVLDQNIHYLQTVSLENNKSDELIQEYDMSYRSTYLRSLFSSKSKLTLNKPWTTDLELLLSADYTDDLLKRRYFYISGSGVTAMPLAREAGEHEGIYLPSAYYSNYKIENRPLTLSAKLKGNAVWNFTESLQNHLLYGFELRHAKNFGEGVVVEDPTRPPYPGNNTYIRSRPNHAIPAMVHGAAYLENSLSYSTDRHSFSSRVGVRATHLFNLPTHYALNKKMLVEPRIRANWGYQTDVGLTTNLRVGYGVEHKLPTLDHLYPDKMYRDFMVLNSYREREDLRYLLTNTFIHDPANPDLRENSNRKLELGLDLSYKRYDFALTLFDEISNAGFEYFSEYYPVAFDRYIHPKGEVPQDRKMGKEDYIKEYHQDFTSFPTVGNTSKVQKRGVEYRLRTPYFSAINTQVEINGAYYHTTYAKGVPVMYRPRIIEANKVYPFVGFYKGGVHTHRQRLNTNLWLNTHVPKFRLLFTNFFQLIWVDRQYLGREESEFPFVYMDLDGKHHPIDEAQVHDAHAKGHLLKYLNMERTDLYYRPENKGFSVRMNFKMSKEFSDKVKASFFVDNIVDISPKYKNKRKQTERNWHIPYFGLELIFNL